MNNFEIRPVANGNNGLYVDNRFAGLYSNGTIIQMSGNEGQLFCVDTCVQYLTTLFPQKIIYSYISHTNNQRHLKVSIRDFPIEEGVKTKHNDTTRN